jgi:hypothetical protein
MTLTGVFVLQFYLPPLPSRKVPSLSLPGPSNRNRRMSLTRAEKEERDELGEQIERRREVYQHELYCKVSTVILSRSPAKCKTEASLEFVSLTCRDLFQHIASNTTSNFRPNPTPRQIAEDPAQVQRATAFLRRELRVWSPVDVEFLTSYILSLLKAIDVRSEPFVRLLADFLETPNGPGYPHAAEHFAHELYCFIRSPYKELVRWDAVAQVSDHLSLGPRGKAEEGAHPVRPRSRTKRSISASHIQATNLCRATPLSLAARSIAIAIEIKIQVPITRSSTYRPLTSVIIPIPLAIPITLTLTLPTRLVPPRYVCRPSITWNAEVERGRYMARSRVCRVDGRRAATGRR